MERGDMESGIHTGNGDDQEDVRVGSDLRREVPLGEDLPFEAALVSIRIDESGCRKQKKERGKDDNFEGHGNGCSNGDRIERVASC